MGICGTFIRNIPSNIIPRFITDYDQLKVAFLFNNYCSHPSLMMCKEILKKHNLKYNDDYFYSADYDLCARALRFFKVQNIPYVLLQYRRHPGQISFAKYIEQERFADIIRINQLVDIFDFNPEEIPILLHLKLMKKEPLLAKHHTEAIQWLQLIIEKNKTINYFNQSILEKFLLMGIN